MTKEEHIARINQKIHDADEVRTDTVVDELAAIWAALDAAAPPAPPEPPPTQPET